MTDGLLRVTKYSLRTHWPVGLGLTGVLVLPPLGFYYLVYLLENSPDSQFVFSKSHFAFLGISAYLFFLFCLAELDHTQKLMARMPVATAALASGAILSTLGIVVMVSLVSNGMYRLFLFDENWYRHFWPVTGPTLFLATLIVVIHGVYWNLQAEGICPAAVLGLFRDGNAVLVPVSLLSTWFSRSHCSLDRSDSN